MKVIKSNRRIIPFGGLVPFLKGMKGAGLPELIRSHFGERVKQAKYGHEDVVIPWILSVLCGGIRIEQITNIAEKIKHIPGLKIPSHDSIGIWMKNLATKDGQVAHTTKKKNPTTTITHFNKNIPANRLLVSGTKSIGGLKTGKGYTMDIDGTMIRTERRGAFRPKDALPGTKKFERVGFNPLVCSIGKLIVHIQMRNGNAHPGSCLLDCIKNSLAILEAEGIKVDRIISDGAGYNKDVIQYLHSKGIKFLIRFSYREKMDTFHQALDECTNWRKTEISSAYHRWPCEVGHVMYQMGGKNKKKTSPPLRVVAMRKPTLEKLKTLDKYEYKRQLKNKRKMERLEKKGKLKKNGKAYSERYWKEYDGYLYKFIFTNDFDSPGEKLIKDYNVKRGNAERNFSVMKNDFGWRIPPFYYMNQNAVYLIMAALANNIYQSMVEIFNEQIPDINIKLRLPKFRKLILNTVCEIFNDGYEFFNPMIDFEKIM